MPTRRRTLAISVITIALAGAAVLAQSNRIDIVTPIAPELAAYGSYPVGVRTITAVDRNRPDILNTKEGGPTARYDRRFVLEVWYPATLAPGQTPGGTYTTTARDPAIAVTLRGQAVRDAAPVADAAPFPLVIISHGYPGNRYLMSHLGENLASKGFVVASIDHPDSTYDDQQAFASTLYNRPLDQLFVLDELARLSQPGSGGFLSGRLDASRTGIVGYSMGGYGLVNVVGGGFSEASQTMRGAPPNRLLGERAAGHTTYAQSIDARVKAAIAIGPWGMQAGLWDAAGLRGIRTPVLFVAGSADEISGYAKGTRALFEGAVNADRHLLTFIDAGHNAAAPHPAPVEVLDADNAMPVAYTHHADAVWDTARMNNILQHFATAYFGVHLQQDAAMRAYLDVVPRGSDAVHAVDRDGRQLPDHTYWKGFKRGTAVGLTLEHAASQALWTIGMYAGASPLELTPLSEVSQPVLTGADVTDMPDLHIDTVAHPSLVRADGRLLLFFTAKDLQANKGGIGLAESTDERTWTFRRTVVREPWVLSGPHVFEVDGTYYMVAESYTEPFVRLYRATSFPDQWEHERDLISGQPGDQFISPTLLRHDGHWYLFTTPGGNDTLRLHHAATLSGPWTEHPSSPLVRNDANTARPAGRPFIWNGAPYRLAQDCEPTYGVQVYAFRITSLSPTSYAEEAVPTPLVSATGNGWNARAMHHVDAVPAPDGGWLAAVDALGRPD